MSESGVNISVQREETKKGVWDRLKGIYDRTPSSTLEESKRFSRLGYLQYPKNQKLELRIFELMAILEQIETDLDGMEGTTLKEEYKRQALTIKRLFRAFMTLGSPWLRGLDNRELAKKAVDYFKLETIIGHLPAFFPDLKLCTEVMLNLSWQAVDVIAQTPVLFETRAIMKEETGRVSLGSEVKTY